MSSSPRVQKLLALIDLVNTAAQTVVQEWTKEDLQAQPERKTEDSIPSLRLYDAQRTIIGSCGGLSELLLHPEHLISEVALGFFQSRALHVAAENHIADILATAEHGSGMSIKKIGARAALDPHKLGMFISRFFNSGPKQIVSQDGSCARFAPFIFSRK